MDEESSKILTLSDLKIRHTLMVLDALRRNEGMSRSELAKSAGCDNTTVTRSVRLLMNGKLIVASGKSESMKGRPREALILNPKGPQIIGISLEPNRIDGVLVDLSGRIRQRLDTPIAAMSSGACYMDAFRETVSTLLKAVKGRCLGMGVSTFGAGMDASHLDFSVHFPDLQEVDLLETCRRDFGMEPEVADMMRCRMQVELAREPELRKGMALLVWLGGGIGMNITVDGQPVPGHRNHGGELGHNVCEPDGLPCACGRRGCLETRCSTGAVLMFARKILQINELDIYQLGALFEADQPEAVALVHDVAQRLGIALANQLNNLNVNNLVLDGELLQLGARFRDDLETEIRRLLFPIAAHGLQIHFRHMDDDGLALGAASLVRERLFSDPVFFAKTLSPKRIGK